VSRFNTSIPAKRSSTELFGVTQIRGESTWAYLKRFNEEMLQMEKLIKLMTLEALINKVRECYTWKGLYALPDISFMKVKQAMKNHIRVEKTNILWHGPPCFYQEAQDKKPFKRSCFLSRENNSKKCHKRPVRKHVQYLEIRNIIPLNITLTIFFMAIKIKDCLIPTCWLISQVHES